MGIRTDWRIGKRAESCGNCGKGFPHGLPFHSAIFLEGESFRRKDLCPICFPAASAATPPFSHWVTTIPKPTDRPRTFDLGLAAEFLRRLAAEGDPARGPLLHFLALLLVRKRAVRLAEIPADAAGPRARVEFHDGHGPVEIPAPPLTEESVPALRGEIEKLLDLGTETEAGNGG